MEYGRGPAHQGRRGFVGGMLAAGLALVLPSQASAQDAFTVDSRIQNLAGYRDDGIFPICLSIFSGRVQNLVLDYIATFEQANIRSQDEMNKKPELQNIKQKISSALNTEEFRKEFISQLQKTRRLGEIFEFEKGGGSTTTIHLDITFYFSDDSNSTLGIQFHTTGVFQPGG